MNTKIYTIALAIAAEALIAVAIFVIIPDAVLPDSIRWLDFSVLTIINAIYALNVLIPFVDLSDRSHKEVAALGLRWTATGWYSALAFLFMLGNVIYAWNNSGEAWSLSVQATVQGAFLLFFLIGIVSSQASMKKAGEVYAEEEATKRGKVDVKAALADMLEAASRQRELSPELRERIIKVAAEGRYLAPSSSVGARDADRAIIADCDALGFALGAAQPSERNIEERLYRLETDIKLRKRQ